MRTPSAWLVSAVLSFLPLLTLQAEPASTSPSLRCPTTTLASPDCQLLHGVVESDVARVQQALKAGANVNVKNEEGIPLLHLLTKVALDVNPKSDLFGRKLSIARSLLDRGVDVTLRDKFQFTALHWIARDARFNSLIDPVIDRGGNPNQAAGDLLETPLILAIDGLNPEGLKQLIRRGGDVNQPIADQIHPLMYAVLKGDVDGLEILLDHGAKIDEPNSFGITPLSMALRTARLETIGVLVRRGADLDVRLNNQDPPRTVAANSPDPEVRKAFNDAVMRYREKKN